MKIMYPALVYDYYDFKGDVKEFVDKMEKDRIAVKKAVNYGWDNSHFHLSDICGGVHCVFHITENYKTIRWEDNKQIKEHMGWIMSIWSDMGQSSIGERKFQEFKDITMWISEVLNHTEKGEYYCQKCNKWYKPEDIKRYSFAGIVCKNCYDAKIHLSPDTSGD